MMSSLRSPFGRVDVNQHPAQQHAPAPKRPFSQKRERIIKVIDDEVQLSIRLKPTDDDIVQLRGGQRGVGVGVASVDATADTPPRRGHRGGLEHQPGGPEDQGIDGGVGEDEGLGEATVRLFSGSPTRVLVVKRTAADEQDRHGPAPAVSRGPEQDTLSAIGNALFLYKEQQETLFRAQLARFQVKRAARAVARARLAVIDHRAHVERVRTAERAEEEQEGIRRKRAVEAAVALIQRMARGWKARKISSAKRAQVAAAAAAAAAAKKSTTLPSPPSRIPRLAAPAAPALAAAEERDARMKAVTEKWEKRMGGAAVKAASAALTAVIPLNVAAIETNPAPAAAVAVVAAAAPAPAPTTTIGNELEEKKRRLAQIRQERMALQNKLETSRSAPAAVAAAAPAKPASAAASASTQQQQKAPQPEPHHHHQQQPQPQEAGSASLDDLAFGNRLPDDDELPAVPAPAPRRDSLTGHMTRTAGLVLSGDALFAAPPSRQQAASAYVETAAEAAASRAFYMLGQSNMVKNSKTHVQCVFPAHQAAVVTRLKSRGIELDASVARSIVAIIDNNKCITDYSAAKRETGSKRKITWREDRLCHYDNEAERMSSPTTARSLPTKPPAHRKIVVPTYPYDNEAPSPIYIRSKPFGRISNLLKSGALKM
jgi:hypothetical protein